MPVLAKHYVSCPPPVVREMTLRDIQALLNPLAPASERDALMQQHPAYRGG